jgi:C_GCAxxG_C_C family probable redox protein
MKGSKMEKRTTIALEHFDKSFNCAQSVMSAYAQEIGLDVDTAMKLASPFGGGMGRMGLVCGAVSSAFLVLGSQFGFTDPAQPDARDRIYSRVQQFAREFTKRQGSILCRELIGYDLSSPQGLADAQASGLLKIKCKDVIQDAIALIEEIRSAGP